MSIDVLYGISALSVPIGLIIAYVLVKRQLSYNNIMAIVDEMLTEATQSEEMQKKIYVVGALLGNGIKQGIGLSKGTGKFKFEDLIMQAGLGFLQKSGLFGAGGGEPQQQQQDNKGPLKGLIG